MKYDKENEAIERPLETEDDQNKNVSGKRTSGFSKVSKAVKEAPMAVLNLFKRKDKSKNVSFGKSIDTEENNVGERSVKKMPTPSEIFDAIKKYTRKAITLIKQAFITIRDGAKELGTETNVFSIIAIVSIAVASTMNITGISPWLSDFSSSFISTLGSGLGFNLCELVADWMSSSSSLLWLFQAVLMIVCFFLDVILNILLLLLVIILFILHILLSIVYVFLLPAGLCVLSIYGLYEDRSLTNIILLVATVCLSILFYVFLII